eukprot:CAMPEP_0176407742 /NCGR_PEP_ID=MMETSP0127-20121128/1572_1 /TAXON_ID=938130 /ORGANISM="Platyophrya macrostoma, Strain WH" /LENGTH=882 /DNA_ID=CAMNT_0017786965 /DNA_START=22 /DNA_END=2670 /DNA_ORIENTATION=+
MSVFLKSLSETQAKQRFALFAQGESSHLVYDLHLTFDLASVSSNLFVDAAVSTITGLIVNGVALENKDNYASLRDDRFLTIPEANLKVGRNTVSIQYKNAYVTDGNGLHTFTDTDGKQYLYSNSEPYHANKAFPCFDQPDLKASWELSVAAPVDWEIISNEFCTSEEQANLNVCSCGIPEEDKEVKLWKFAPTKRISSYLFVVVAGPYSKIKAENTYKGISTSLYCRESLFKYLKEQADEIIEINSEGMRFYEEFFGYPYPFSKYDFIYCPEYNVGAMENPGAVTFNDRLIFRDDVTLQQRTNRARTTLHELAHMWFGNLVTMKWWNDLWLNESFADFISFVSMEKVRPKLTKVKLVEPMLEFFRRKWWGYRQDQLSTTHPIAGEVEDTAKAESIFDGITYSKGAATMKQILKIIGEEAFSKSMNEYFHKHEWKNTTLEDFISSLQANYKPLNPTYPSDLSEWQKMWLQTAGLNELEPHWDPTKTSNKEKIVIKQSAARSDHPTLRTHKLKIALFNSKAEVIHVIDTMIEPKEETIVEYDGSIGAKALLLNYEDEAFVKIRIDSTSLDFLKQNLKLVPDEFTRSIVWRALWDMVRDGHLSTLGFVDVASNAIFDETSDVNLTNILQFASGSIQSFTPKKARDLLNFKLFTLVHALLLETDPANKNRTTLLLNELLTFATNGYHLEQMVAWLDEKHPTLGKYKLSLSNAWIIVRRVQKSKKFDQETKARVFELMKKRDPSDNAKKYTIEFEALAVPSEEKEKWWKNYQKQGELSVHMSGASMRGFVAGCQGDEAKPFHDDFFKVVLSVFQNNRPEYAEEFYDNLFPNGEDLETYLEKAKKLLSEIDQKVEFRLATHLKESIDGLQRQLKCYEYFKNDLFSAKL